MKSLLKNKVNPVPARRISAGQHLLDELEARHLTQADLADSMNCPAETINAMIHGAEEITIETAKGLEQALGIPAHVWLNLDRQFRLYRAEK